MNFVSYCTKNGGKVKPLFIERGNMMGTSFTSPSVFYDGTSIHLNVRDVGRHLYNAENNKYIVDRKPLRYVYPQTPDGDPSCYRVNDIIGHIPDETMLMKYRHSTHLHYPRHDEFKGSMNFNLVGWNNNLYLVGASYSTNFSQDTFTIRAESTVLMEVNYCSRHWSPIIDMPFTFLRTANPVRLYEINLDQKETSEIISRQKNESFGEWSPVSQVVKLNGYYTVVVQESYPYYLESGGMNIRTRHRFVQYDDNWNLIRVSRDFTFLNNEIECCSGLTVVGDVVWLTFSIQDQSSFALNVTKTKVQEFIDDSF